MKRRARNAGDVPCPCGSRDLYGRCCGRLIGGGEIAVTAEQLMRSRYTAYVLRDEPYLLATWHESTRPGRVDLDESVKWLGLRVLATAAGGPDDTEGRVTFVARCRVGGAPAQRLHEDSRFVREKGRWYYVSGEPGAA